MITDPVCQESDSCWNWATMGNNQMGGWPTQADITLCENAAGEAIYDPATDKTTCEASGVSTGMVVHIGSDTDMGLHPVVAVDVPPVPHYLPVTGSSDMLFGIGSIMLALGAIASIFSRRHPAP